MPVQCVTSAVPAVAGERLLERFGALADPRRPRGVRHSVGVIVALASAAVAAGARSFAAIGEWAAEAPGDVLAMLGARVDPRTGLPVAPCESTIRRTLQILDPDALDGVLGAWLARRQSRSGPADEGPPAVAVDGKTLRGARRDDGRQVHLLAAMTHTGRAVIAQRDVDAKTNEISEFAPLLDPLDLRGVVVTADAMHTQRAHARYLVEEKEADYVFSVKDNQPGLFAALDALPWGQVPVAHTDSDRGHGRAERRTIQVLPAPEHLRFPHAKQAFLVERHVADLHGTPRSAIAVLGVTSLTPNRATPGRIAALVRGHWTIEALHWTRDVTYDEDRCQIRTGHAPRVLASLRNLAIAALRRAGHTNTARGLRWAARDPQRPLTILGLNS